MKNLYNTTELLSEAEGVRKWMRELNVVGFETKKMKMERTDVIFGRFIYHWIKAHLQVS